jgi:hypothetical protein
LSGPLAAPTRTLDVAALTGWLTLRAAELQTRRLELLQVDSRQDVIGRPVRADFPAMRPKLGGGIVETEPAQVPLPGSRGLQLLQQDVPTAAAVPSPKPRPAQLPAPPPAAPHTAGPALPAPLNLLLRP